MGKKISILLTIFLGFLHHKNLEAQELNCKVVVMGDQVTGVDAKVFKTLEQDASTFLNTRKWGNDVLDNKEKIECLFTIVLNKKIDGVEDGYVGRLSVQSTRPIFNSTYTSPMINYTDKDFSFKYTQYQPLDFNDNRVSGNDPLIANLTATIAYYAYLILGMDYDSFSQKGGTDFFNRAQNIVNNAPENKAIIGWKAAESQKNRYWLIDQIQNNRFVNLRTLVYKYHRLGLDMMSTEPEQARNNINTLFSVLQQINSENPASMLINFFITTKSEEIRNFLVMNSLSDRQKLVPILSIIDVSNASKYADLLK